MFFFFGQASHFYIKCHEASHWKFIHDVTSYQFNEYFSSKLITFIETGNVDEWINLSKNYVRGRGARTKVENHRASRGSRAARTPGQLRRYPRDNRRRCEVCWELSGIHGAASTTRYRFWTKYQIAINPYSLTLISTGHEAILSWLIFTNIVIYCAMRIFLRTICLRG